MGGRVHGARSACISSSAKALSSRPQTLRGDLLMLGGVFCWATYSVASQPILKRHSPLVVIGLTFSIGAALYVLMMVPTLMDVNWGAVSGFSWFLMVASALLALNVSYWIWYTGLKRLGGSRTSVYSYLTPIVAMIVAAIWIGEPISGNQIAGADGDLRRAADHAVYASPHSAIREPVIPDSGACPWDVLRPIDRHRLIQPLQPRNLSRCD